MKRGVNHEGRLLDDSQFDATRHHYTVLQRFYEKMFGTTSIHFPLWLPGTETIDQAVTNAERLMADAAGIEPGMRVLDAGCGLGHSAYWLAENRQAKVLGINIVPSNVDRAREIAHERGLSDRVGFEVVNYMSDPFEDESFDVVWNLESFAYARPKEDYLAWVHRVLKPGGRWVCIDGFIDRDKCRGFLDRRSVSVAAKGFGYPDMQFRGTDNVLALVRGAGLVDGRFDDLTAHLGDRTRTVARIGTLKSILFLKDYFKNRPKYFERISAFRATDHSTRLFQRGVGSYGLMVARKPE